MKIKDLTDHLETIAPLHLQESYDNAGLLTGKYEWDIKGVMISLDATEAVIEEAIEKGCNVVVSHHPIIFSGLKRVNGYHYIERAIIKAIKHDIALYAIHTNLDNVLKNGVSMEMCKRLELNNVEILAKKADSTMETGLGAIGVLPNPLSAEECLRYIKDKMKTGTIKHTTLLQRSIQKVAVCGGSGSSFLSHAIDQGADMYISADFKYHEFFESNNEIIIADIGHFESEQFTIDLLYEILKKKFSNFALFCTSVATNPIKYF
jgi:dinuclear metal center YbgI/SA1388 family protein